MDIHVRGADMTYMYKACHGCEFRHPACHDNCTHGYKEEKEKDEQIKKARRLEIEYNACVKELSYERKKKWQKKKK